MILIRGELTPIIGAIGDVPLFWGRFLFETEILGEDFLSGLTFLDSIFKMTEILGFYF